MLKCCHHLDAVVMHGRSTGGESICAPPDSQCSLIRLGGGQVGALVPPWEYWLGSGGARRSATGTSRHTDGTSGLVRSAVWGPPTLVSAIGQKEMPPRLVTGRWGRGGGASASLTWEAPVTHVDVKVFALVSFIFLCVSVKFFLQPDISQNSWPFKRSWVQPPLCLISNLLTESDIFWLDFFKGFLSVETRAVHGKHRHWPQSEASPPVYKLLQEHKINMCQMQKLAILSKWGHPALLIGKGTGGNRDLCLNLKKNVYCFKNQLNETIKPGRTSEIRFTSYCGQFLPTATQFIGTNCICICYFLPEAQETWI